MPNVYEMKLTGPQFNQIPEELQKYLKMMPRIENSRDDTMTFYLPLLKTTDDEDERETMYGDV